jgi:hypothetical protein
MMRKGLNIKLIGSIVPLTPVSVTRPDTPDDKRGVPRMQIMIDRHVIPMGVINGETLKGRFRNISTGVIARKIACQSGEPDMSPFGIDQYNFMAKGGIKGSEKQGAEDLLRAELIRRKNPQIGLYGSSTPWVGGCLIVCPAMPRAPEDIAITEATGLRQDDFSTYPQLLAEFAPEERDHYMRYVRSMKRHSALKGDFESLGREIGKLTRSRSRPPEDEARLTELRRTEMEVKAEIETVKASDEFSNAINRPLPPKRGIAPGSILQHRIELVGASNYEVGLFFETMREFADLCRIGGHKGAGYGYIELSYRIRLREGNGPWQEGGRLEVGPERFEVTSSSTGGGASEPPRALQRALDAWETASADMAAHFNFAKEFAAHPELSSLPAGWPAA